MNKLFAWLRSRLAPSPKQQKRIMTHPISQERIDFLNARKIVVEKAIRIAQAHAYQLPPGNMKAQVQAVLTAFQVEQTSIEIELRVLSELVMGA